MPEVTQATLCAEMDMEKPVHCGTYQADAQALEQLAGTPTTTPSLASIVIPVIEPAFTTITASTWLDAVPEPESNPPYLRTHRLRI